MPESISSTCVRARDCVRVRVRLGVRLGVRVRVRVRVRVGDRASAAPDRLPRRRGPDMGSPVKTRRGRLDGLAADEKCPISWASEFAYLMC